MAGNQCQSRTDSERRKISEYKMKFGVSQSSDSSSSSSDSGNSRMGGPKSSETLELPVWVDGKEKWVNGLTRRTTCDDIIYALLLQVCGSKSVDVSNYILYERWRGMERPLQGRTKILKVWRAWAAENHNVDFSMKKNDSGLDISSEASKTRRGRRSKHGQQKVSRVEHKRHRSSSSARTGVLKGAKEKPQVNGSTNGKAKVFHELVHTILEQEREAHDQLGRIKEMDIQIDTFETRMHLSRMKENGANYVQEAYLRERSEESGSSSGNEEGAVGGVRGKSRSRSGRSDEVAYLELYSSVLDIEEKLEAKRLKITELSTLIHGESIECGGTSEKASRDSSNVSAQEILLQRLTDEVTKCLKVSEEQTRYMDQIEATLEECEAQLSGKQDYLKCLESELDGCGVEVDANCLNMQLQDDEIYDEGFHQDLNGPTEFGRFEACNKVNPHELDQSFHTPRVNSTVVDKGLVYPKEESAHFLRDLPSSSSQGLEPLATIPEGDEYNGHEKLGYQFDIEPNHYASQELNSTQDERIQKLKMHYIKSTGDVDFPDGFKRQDYCFNDSSISFPPSIPQSPCDQSAALEPPPCHSEGTLCGFKPYITYTNYTCCRGPSSDSDSTDTGVGSIGSNEDGIAVLETLV